MEKTLGIGLDHMHMCHFDQSKGPESSELTAFITNALDNATELITSRLKACETMTVPPDNLHRLINMLKVEFTYATMSSYSPTASEVAVKGIFQTVASFNGLAYLFVKHSSYLFTPQYMPPMGPLLQDMKWFPTRLPPNCPDPNYDYHVCS